MIEINLLPGPKKKRKASAGIGISLDQFKAIFDQVKDPLLVGAVACWVVGILVIAFFYTTDTGRMGRLQEELTRVEQEQKRFQVMIDQKRKAERLRDSLVAEINVIRSIDGERFVWGHILEEVTRALPDYTWLVSVEPLSAGPAAPAPGDSAVAAPAVRIQVEGRTSDIQAYTRFLRQIAESPWITSIVPGPTNTVQEQDRPVIAFSLSAQYRRADSAYIRTAPLIQTLR